MKIGITSDHRGFILKQKLIKYLKENNYEVIDYGTKEEKKVDYPKYAFILGEAIQKNEIEKGIAICGTGIGMSIALNKMKNVICAKISNKKEAYYAKNHNNANCISLSGNTSYNKAKKMIKTYLETETNNEKHHQTRRNMIKEYEDKND